MSGPSTTYSLITLKRALRKAVQQTLRAIPSSAVEAQSQDLFRRITTTEPFLSSKALSIFLSMPHSEIQTLPLVRHALEQGKQVYVPLIPAQGRMTMVRLYDDDGGSGTGDGWERDRWGIPIVGPERPAGQGRREDVFQPSGQDLPLDLIFLPAVAFSPSPIDPTTIDRLGHGKGYYDTFLARYDELCKARSVPSPTLVGLALREQWLATGTVPTGEHDVPLRHVEVAFGASGDS